jgi:hypothetical protein
MTQDYLRQLHRAGRFNEMSFDTPRDEPPVLESIEAPVINTRAKRTPGGLPSRERKRRSRQHDRWRAEVFELTGDQQLVASVVDRGSYVRGLQIAARREERRADDLVEYRSRLCFDNGEFACWQSLGVTGPRIVVQCFEEDMRRGGSGSAKRRPLPRLSENAGACESVEIIRVIDRRVIDRETSEMFSRILAREKVA